MYRANCLEIIVFALNVSGKLGQSYSLNFEHHIIILYIGFS